MTRIGALVVAAQGHINPTLSLCRSLQDRGHEIIVFCNPTSRETIEKGGFKCHALGAEVYSERNVQEWTEKISRLKGFVQVRFIAWLLKQGLPVTLHEVPRCIKKYGIDIMLIDEISHGAATGCDHVQVPYVVLSNALPFTPDPAVPPVFSNGHPATTVFGRWLNTAMHYVTHYVLYAGSHKIVQKQRAQWNLPPISKVYDEYAGAPHIIQEPKAFSFPRYEPKNYQYFVGPFHTNKRPWTDVPFPWEKLNGKPLIYASMGTLQNGQEVVFQTIAAACKDEDAQLVISLGGSMMKPESLGELPGNPLLVKFAPQLALLDRASACITHAGLNTTLECLVRGVPMVALPVGADQPAVAARIDYHGAGISLKTSTPTVQQLRNAVHKVLMDKQFANRARELGKEADPMKARERACAIIEDHFENSKNQDKSRYK